MKEQKEEWEEQEQENNLPWVADFYPPWDGMMAVLLILLSTVVLFAALVTLLAITVLIWRGEALWIEVLIFIGIPLLPLLAGLLLFRAGYRGLGWIRSGRPS